ncbi:MAG: hypothetical protein A2015_03480 [Spirochaetes bacterium GWF1_31_7]|nr:MAG: hypothetical protein A2Y30_07565 [Spirochaetes bacterium GWE1_32_154]OHD48441.1 MAG: hypothetical protein A2Y29_05440 [Spirochaetes bacterium GWE2_31_10]OHD50918.1 MAG: hypothetical protein A2015_03480 [Spirochaetes bacterium GWF1_31_7]OHD80512.1 MAG: hypothetical protein A2355_01610 [Spirochaetes bacterium RIFOXYB1_FULL_32_8]HBD92870.1 hypothetical protein [Spirochaetia bacterium]
MDKINNNYYLFNTDLKNKDLKKKKNINDKDTKQVTSRSFFNNLFESEQLLNESEIIEKQSIEYESFREEISVMLKDIGNQGKKLKQNRNIIELEKYKKIIKSFLNKIINASESVTLKSIYNSKKKEKISKLHLSIIDEELLHLTRTFIDAQSSIIKLASQLDKIEGLLLDLAF